MKWSDYATALVKKCKNTGIPCTASFEMTPLCNFNCNMCYIHLSPEEAKRQGKLLTTDQWLRIAEEAKLLGTLGLEITGGEAVTRPDFPFLYEKLIKMGFIITLRSNGYLIRGELLELFKHYKPRFISITLYGASDETYYRVTGKKDGFSVVTQNILALREAGINVILTVTVTKDNEGDRKKLIEWANENGFHVSFYGGLFTPIRSAKRSIEHLKADYGIDFSKTENLAPDREIVDREKYMHPFRMCREYGAKFCVSWDGHMTICNCFPSVWADALNQSVKDAYKELYQKLNSLKRPSECADCQFIDYCGACPARLLSDAGSHEITNDSICKMARVNYLHSIDNNTQINSVDTNNNCLN